MNRPSWTSQEIQDELQRQVNNIEAIINDDAQIFVPLPSREPEDEFGVNWNIASIPSVNYISEIRSIIDQLRFQVRLKD
jgi:hypothetical protein